MRIAAVKNVSAIAVLAALAVVPFSEAYAQGNGQGNPSPGSTGAAMSENPNAGPGNNSSDSAPGATGAAMSGNPNAGPGENSSDEAPGATGLEMSGNSNAGPGNNSGNGNTSPGTPRSDSGGSTQTPGPDSGHNCGGQGHIDNDAPGHQHDDCPAGASGPMSGGSTAIPSAAAGANAGGAAVVGRNGAPVAGQAPGVNGANNAAGGASGFATADCSMTAGLTPLFGALTQQEVQVLATADQAAVVVVVCPEVSTNPEAQQAVAQNPGITRALEAQGFGVHQVIAADAGEPVPTIYVEAPSTN